MNRLFISSFDTARTLKRLIATLCVVIVIMIGCDLLLGHLIKESPNILNGLRTEGIDRLWQMNNEGLTPIVFVGSSQVEAGISPHVFDQRIQDRTGQSVTSVNTGLNAFQAVLTFQEIKGVIMPTNPSVIIYGIEMRALNGKNLYNTAWQTIQNSLLGYEFQLDPGIEQTALLWLMRHSALVRYAKQYRAWFSGDTFIPYDDRGHMVRDTASKFSGFIYSDYTNFQISKPLNDALLGIGEMCHQRNLPCILLNLPIHNDAYQIIDPKDAASYYSTLRTLAAQSHLPLWDFNTEMCRAQFDDHYYFDLSHLNEMGARKFTPAVADLYAQEIMGQKLPPSSGATCAEVIGN